MYIVLFYMTLFENYIIDLCSLEAQTLQSKIQSSPNSHMLNHL